MASVSRKYMAISGLALLAAFFACQGAVAQPFTVQGPGVNSNDFRITTFASGLDFPLGMTTLSDGSLLVALGSGTSYFNSTFRLARFTDTNQNGIADGPGTTLYTGAAGAATDVRAIGNLVFVSGPSRPISVLRKGATPSDPLTLIGQIIMDFPTGWEHGTGGLTVRRTPGQSNAFDVVFQVGSKANFAVTTETVPFTNSNLPGASGNFIPDSLHMFTFVDHGTSVSVTNMTQIANGLRNPAGGAFHPVTGDFYFQDNGIDGLINGNEPHSADELNFIARTNVGGPVEFFGFPSNYTVYRTGALVGGGGIQPIINFLALPNPANGAESEGPNNIAFAPPGFPAGLNTGILLGFHGKFTSAGISNEENPVVYANPSNGTYFHFIAGQQVGIGHLDGLLATKDSLFVADIATTGNIFNSAGTGAIYQIKSLVNPPPVLQSTKIGSQLVLTWDRGTLQEATAIAGPWTDVTDAFSPKTIQTTGPQKFYRAAY